MAAAQDLTFDIAVVDGGARRPTINDVGGAALKDDEEDQPDYEGRMPYAAMLNQGQKQAVATGAIVASARLTIDFDAGVPFVAALMCPSRTLVAADFALTDNGAGDVTIAWPAGRLPPIVCDPMGNCNAGVVGTTFDAEVVSGTSVRVRVGTGAVAADHRFTIALH
jgi:hypothetical protein